ncbi:hypothetical protein AB0K14_29455 [Actinosynnema sp. NPDC050801]|uniref:hypothetical protein n=1 Tax=unclassified Actinosynnema TaxID=2637065 RepID=UPI00340444FB
MNTTLPPARDLPPHRRAQLRARLEQEVTGGRRAVRFAPLVVAGLAAAAVVVLVAVVAPWRQTSGDAAVGDPVVVTTTTSASPAWQGPVIPGLSPQRVAEVEQGCLDSTLRQGKATLYQYLTDEVGAFALLYTASEQLSCTVDGPTTPYNASSALVWDSGWLPGALALDGLASAAGGDGGKADHAGRAGYDMAVGRVTGQVAKVVYLHGGRSVEARIANGTFVARIAHPADWVPPDGWDRMGVVHAYDAQGALLGEWRNEWDPTRCWVRPDGVVVAGARDLDPAKCLPAVAWR